MFELLISLDAGQALRVHLVNQCRNYQLQAAIFHEALLSCLPISGVAESNITSLHYRQAMLPFAESAFVFSDQSSLNNGKTKKKAPHVTLMSRPTERKLHRTLTIYTVFGLEAFILT